MYDYSEKSLKVEAIEIRLSSSDGSNSKSTKKGSDKSDQMKLLQSQLQEIEEAMGKELRMKCRRIMFLELQIKEQVQVLKLCGECDGVSADARKQIGQLKERWKPEELDDSVLYLSSNWSAEISPRIKMASAHPRWKSTLPTLDM